MTALPSIKRSLEIKRRALASMLLAALAPCISQGSAGSTPQDDVRTLLSGTPFERQIAGSEAHSYRITLAAGDFLRISIHPKGADLVSEFFLPDGTLAATADTSHGSDAPTAISFVADVAGDHALRIHPSKPDAERGRYRIEVAELRIATAEDRGRFNARRAFEEARGLALKNTAEQNRMAIASYGRAMELFREIGDRKGELTAMIALAESHLWSGNPLEALEYHRQAIQCARQIGGRYSEANIHLGVGRIEATFGNYQEALNSYNRALEIYRGMSAKYGEALALSLTGSAYRSLGDDRQALDLYERALPTFHSVDDFHNEGTVLDYIGQAYAGLGDVPKALEFYTRALAISREQKFYRLEAPTLGYLGNAHLLLGEKRQAVEDYRQSLKVAQTAGLQDDEAVALRSIAEIALADGNPDEAGNLLLQALEIFRSLGRSPELLKTLSILAQVRYAKGEIGEARAAIEEALEIGESLRMRILEPELRQSFFVSVQSCFQLSIDILMQLHQSDPAAGYDAAALSESERARARSLLELLQEAGADIRRGVSAELLERERDLQHRLNAKAAARERLLGDSRTAAQAASFESEIAGLAARYRDIEAQIRLASPAYASLTSPRPLAAAEIQKLLDDNTVLLELSLGERKSWLWAVTSRATESYQLPSRSVLEAAARKVYEDLTARQPRLNEPESERRARSAEADARFLRDAGALSDMLFKTMAPKLHRDWRRARLVVVASGAIGYTPFSALPAPGGGEYRPLIADHEIINLPSASALALMRARPQQREAGSRSLAVLADPVVDARDPRIARAGSGEADPGRQGGQEASRPAAPAGSRAELERSLASYEARGWRSGFSRLPFSREEADRITAFVPDHSFFKGVGFQASRATVMSGELGRYRMVHFATHGLLNSEHPELSGLVLSLYDQQGRQQDGFLRVNEIYSLSLPADIVVLSACQTALGKEIRGEGIIGLTRGFMFAGARRVVSSLWQVDDLATAELMARFYQGMLKDGMRAAEALRKAQLEMAGQKRWAPPYFWAGFTLQGEWR